jgi:pimeloyl-ACP methyl ester carboxylesterase
MVLLRLKLPLLVAITSLCGFGAVSGRTLSASAQAPYIPRFIAAPCPFIPAVDQAEGTTVSCGFVAVPENRVRPNGRWIKLAVAIFKAPEIPTQPPLIFLGGGPGSFVLEGFGPRVSGTLARDLTAGRDFVMFDQRGVGFSEPALDCQELRDLRDRTIQTHPTRDQEIDDRVEAGFACRDRLLGSGIELAAYNTEASAADVNDIRRALGYGQLDVWGLSYGTRLALVVERNFPEAVHSLVLDSALPPPVNQLVDRAANAERAFRVLFDSCAADVACASAYPNLETVFYDLVARLNLTPARYLAQHPVTGKVYNVVLTGDRLVATLVDALVPPFLIPSVPLVAMSIHNGDFTLMSQATSLLWFDDSHSAGMFYSVNCADNASRTSPPQVSAARTNVRPEIAAALREDARLRICAGWGAAQPGPGAATPVASDVPTLILAGEYDPLTPPRYATIAGRTLRNSDWFQFPAMGHNLQRSSPCAHQMIMEFLANPALTPDASCIAEMQPPRWVIPPN